MSDFNPQLLRSSEFLSVTAGNAFHQHKQLFRDHVQLQNRAVQILPDCICLLYTHLISLTVLVYVSKRKKDVHVTQKALLEY